MNPDSAAKFHYIKTVSWYRWWTLSGTSKGTWSKQLQCFKKPSNDQIP